MQRKLTALLATQSGLEVMSFQHFDCLVFNNGETLKMFLPRSKRVLGGNAQERMVIGSLLVICEQDLEQLRPPSKRFTFSTFLTSIPIGNFPSITPSSMLLGGEVDMHFFAKIHDLLRALPDSRSDWIAKFGDDFLTRSPIDRCVITIEHLRQGGWD